MRYKAAAAILFAGTLAFLAPRPASATWSVSISYFHEELAPYGRWVSATAYGDVWCPTVAAGWQPYLDGEWEYTDYGWTWVSYDPFGGDPFHYGTWVWVDPYGWCWVPGTVWGPAWVTWAYTDSYVGWACLPPTFEITSAGYAGSPVVVPQSQYVFVPTTNFVGTRVSSVRVPVQQNATILTHASRATRFSVSGGIVRASGPPSNLIQRATGKPLRRASVSSQKLRVSTVAAAGIASGKRLRIAAPAHERAAAMEKGKSNPSMARRSEPSGKRPKEVAAGASVASRRPSHAVKAKPSNGKSAASENAVKASRNAPSEHGNTAAEHRPATRGVRGRDLTTSKPHTDIERKSSAPTGPPPKEVRNEKATSSPEHRAVERRDENPPPSVAHERQPHPAAPPEASHARPAPPQQAMAKPPEHPSAQPRPQGPPAKQKEKEKGKE